MPKIANPASTSQTFGASMPTALSSHLRRRGDVARLLNLNDDAQLLCTLPEARGHGPGAAELVE
eukprot:6789676-Pyramimonas_sp.AAC.1